MKKYIVEICASSLQSGMNAQNVGSNRIELCDNLIQGGTSPSYGTIKLASEKLSIDVQVLIRPRGGDFLYSDLEFDIMKNDIVIAKHLGVAGIVLGILTKDGNVDTIRTAKLVDLAYPLSVTFHRAFDLTVEPLKALHDIINIGCTRILTSGQKNTAIEGIELIKNLVKEANDKIVIMAGSGINKNNIVELRDNTDAKEFHLSGQTIVKSKMLYSKNDVKLNADLKIPENSYMESNEKKMEEIINLLKKN